MIGRTDIARQTGPAPSAELVSEALRGALLPSDGLIDRLPVGVCACDAEGNLVQYNRRAAELWGRAPDLGQPGADRFCGALRAFTPEGAPLPLSDAPMAEALRTGAPVRDRELVVERPDGSRITILANVDPVRAPDGALLGAINCFQDVSERKRAEAGTREREQRFRDMFDALPAAVYTTDGGGRITFFNEAAVKLWGRRPELGEMWCGSWRLFWPDGRPMNHDECPMAVALRENRPVRGATAIAERPDGTRVAFEPYPTPLHDASGNLVGAINKMLDISEREQAERRQRRLIDELNHRVKNTLSTVQSLASQTARTTRSRREFRQMFEARLVSLSKAHDQLTRRGWQDADLRAIVSGEIAAHQGTDTRIIVDGGEVRLSPRLALTLAMIVHELATNAAKYGALSAAEGCVRVSWRVDVREGSRPTLRIAWEESGGPPVAPPRRRGFGTMLVERSVAAEHGGRSSLDFAEAGLHATIEIPLDGG